jgi:hypothetical protein
LKLMYRRPKFLELLLEIRREMAHEADYDVDLFVEMARHGSQIGEGRSLSNGEPAGPIPEVISSGPNASARKT